MLFHVARRTSTLCHGALLRRKNRRPNMRPNRMEKQNVAATLFEDVVFSDTDGEILRDGHEQFGKSRQLRRSKIYVRAKG